MLSEESRSLQSSLSLERGCEHLTLVCCLQNAWVRASACGLSALLKPWEQSCILAPTILLSDLGFFFRSEVVHNIELLPDLLCVLALDHGRHLGARQIQ